MKVYPLATPKTFAEVDRVRTETIDTWIFSPLFNYPMINSHLPGERNSNPLV
jgi:hypothetical protein